MAPKRNRAGMIPKLENELNLDDDLDDGNVLLGDLSDDDGHMTNEEKDALRDLADKGSRKQPNLLDEDDDDLDDDPIDNSDPHAEDEDDEEQSSSRDDEEDEPEDDEDDGETYGKKVNKRIARETRQKHQARREAEEAAARAAAAEAKVYEANRKQIELEKQLFELAATTQAERVEFLSAAVTTARENADYAQETALQNKLNDALAHKRQAEEGLAAKERQLKEAPEKPAPKSGTPETDQLPAEAQRWIAKNKWFNEPSGEDERLYIQGYLGPLLRKKGYDWRDPDFYEQLNRELYKKFPNRNRKLKARQDMADQRGRQNGGNRTGIGERSAPNNGQPKTPDNQLTPKDKGIMKMLGIDTNNKEQVAYYLRNKRNQVAR